MAGGVELATAYVSLVVEGSKVAPGVKKAMGVADPEAARAGDRAGRSFTSRFGSALKIGGTLAAAFAVTKGVQFLGDAIDEAREASVVTARTANVIKSMGNVAGLSAKQVANLAGSISNKVGIDDEAIQSGENLLLTFGKIRDEVGAGNDIFTQTTGLMVDMSVAMDQDMKSSAIQLGKALNDPIKGVTALSRVGVSFTEQQIDQIKKLTETNDVLGAQKIILGEVKKQFGGAGEAMATPADRAKVAWGNLKEQIGTELLPTVNRVTDWFADEAVPAISDFFTEFRKGKGTAGDIKDGLNDAKDAVVNFFDEFKDNKGFGGDVRDVVEDVRDAVEGAAGFAKDLVGWFNDMPAWAKKAIITGGIAAAVLPKIPGGSTLTRSATSALGQALGSAKPVPVFVTNPGFGTPGQPGPPGSKPPKGPAGGAPGANLWTSLGFGLPAMVPQTFKPEELGWEKLEGDLLKVNAAFVQIAESRTGIDNLTGATEALDGIIAGMTLEKPRQGFSALWNLSQKTGISMADLRDVLPATNKAIEESGIKARGSARETGTWRDTIVGLGRETDKVDGKKPDVPWSFPGLFGGINDTGKLGRDTDDVGRKKPAISWSFPNLTAGLFNVQTLGRNIRDLPDHKTITITTFHNDTYGGLAGGGGHEPKPRAMGGPVYAGKPYIVGERQPELFIPSSNGRIDPSPKMGGISESNLRRLTELLAPRLEDALYRGAAERAGRLHAARRT